MDWLDFYSFRIKTLATLHPYKKSTGSIGSISALCAALGITEVELTEARALKDDERYVEVKSPPKADGSFRTVFNPTYLIRKIQRRLNKRIFSNTDIIAWPDHIFGSIANQIDPSGLEHKKDYISCASMHCGAKSILHLDVQNFFNNIHKDQVYGIFEDFLKCHETVAEALTDICCSNDHLVQGALTSSYLATLCLYDSEGEIVNRLRRKNLTYTRLVDDITISAKTANHDFTFAEKLVEDMLSAKDLPINSKKTRVRRISTEPLTVHGLRIAFKQPRLPSDEVRRIRSAVKGLEVLSRESNYRTTHPYRKDFNRCMGRVNKLKRVGHLQHEALYQRLKKIFPLPSPKDIGRIGGMIERLKLTPFSKRDSYWYKRRFYLVHERITILKRTYKSTAESFRNELRLLKPSFE